MFGTDIFKIAHEYASCISPAEWTYYVFIPIWLWQLLWIFYGLGNDCRKTQSGNQVSEFEFIPSDVFVCYSMKNVLLTVWMQLYTRQRVIFSSVAIVFVFVFLVIACVRSCRHLHLHLNNYLSEGLSKDVIFVRTFLQNGLACYAVFICQVMLENIVASLFFTYDVIDKNSPVAYVSSATLATALLILFWIDIIFYDVYMRYIIGPYVFYLYILAGLFSENYDVSRSIGTSMFLACVATCCGFVLMTKIFLTIYRHVKNPLGNQCRYEITATVEDV